MQIFGFDVSTLGKGFNPLSNKGSEITSLFKRCLDPTLNSITTFFSSKQTGSEFILSLKESGFAFVESSRDTLIFRHVKLNGTDHYFKGSLLGEVSEVSENSIKDSLFSTFESVDFTRVQKRWKGGKLYQLKLALFKNGVLKNKGDAILYENRHRFEGEFKEIKLDLQLMIDYLFKQTPKEEKASSSTGKEFAVGFLVLSAASLLGRFGARVTFPGVQAVSFPEHFLRRGGTRQYLFRI